MTVWTDPNTGIRFDNIVPLGVRVVAAKLDSLDRMECSDMAKRIAATKSRPISEAMPEFFIPEANQGNARVVPIRGWKDE